MEQRDVRDVVIVGGGFGGLRAAQELGKKLKKASFRDQYRITLIDQYPFHTYTPTLYLGATLSDAYASVDDLHETMTFSYRSLLRDLPVQFLQSRISRIDTEKKDVHLASGAIIHADYLVLALGSEPNYFGMDQVAQYSQQLKSFSDALQIREQFLHRITSGGAHARIVIVGGGPTGVELAAEMALLCKERSQCVAHVMLVTGSRPAMAAFGDRMSERVTARLKKLGVDVVTGDRLSDANEDHVTLKSGRCIPYDLFIWTGGVTQHHLLTQTSLVQDERSQRILVDDSLRAEGVRDVFVIGDGAGVFDPKRDRLVPMVARAAISEGSIVAKNIFEDIRLHEGASRHVREYVFRPFDYPYAAPVGGKYIVAKVGPFVLPPFVGFLFKLVIELGYFISIMPFSKAFSLWWKSVRVIL